MSVFLWLQVLSNVVSPPQDAWVPRHVSRDDGLWAPLRSPHEQHAWDDEHTGWAAVSHGAKHGQQLRW